MSFPAGPILFAILQLPPCWADRHDSRQFDHLTRVAYAIGEEARDIDEAAALVAIGKNESGLCIAVQDHYTHSGGFSTYQLEGWNGKYPGPFVGLSYESIHRATYAAVDIWRHSFQYGPGISARLYAYAGQYPGKHWPGVKPRMDTYYFVRGVLAKEMKNAEKG